MICIGASGHLLAEAARRLAVRGRLEGIFGEPGRSIAADHLVTWNGGEPDLTLSAQLTALGVEHTIIGDAVRPRRFADATEEAKTSVDAWKPAIPANAVHAPL